MCYLNDFYYVQINTLQSENVPSTNTPMMWNKKTKGVENAFYFAITFLNYQTYVLQLVNCEEVSFDLGQKQAIQTTQQPLKTP